MPTKRVAVAPYVTGDDIGVFKMVFYEFYRMEIVFCRIFRIDDQFDAVFIYQLFVFFFHEANNDIYLIYPDLM